MKLWGNKPPKDVDPWDRPEERTSSPMRQIMMSIVGAVMTLVSYLLVFRLPDNLAWRDYGTFFLAVLLFCVGFFWLISYIPEPVTKVGILLRNMGICGAAACLLAGSVWYVYARDGSEGSIYAATVFLIQSIVFLMGLDKSWIETRAARLTFRLVSIGLAGFGLWLLIQYVLLDDSRDGLVTAATLLWIVSIVLYGIFGKSAGDDEEQKKTAKSRRK